MADYPVKVPPELFTEWLSEARLQYDAKSGTVAAMVADRAAQWGADHQLKACCKALDDIPGGWGDSRHLLHICRPKPPSLAEQALIQYDRFVDMVKDSGCIPAGCVRDALKRLAELESNP